MRTVERKSAEAIAQDIARHRNSIKKINITSAYSNWSRIIDLLLGEYGFVHKNVDGCIRYINVQRINDKRHPPEKYKRSGRGDASRLFACVFAMAKVACVSGIRWTQ